MRTARPCGSANRRRAQKPSASLPGGRRPATSMPQSKATLRRCPGTRPHDRLPAMKIAPRLLAFALAAAVAAAPSLAAAAERVGTFEKWEVVTFEEGGATGCYVMSRPEQRGRQLHRARPRRGVRHPSPGAGCRRRGVDLRRLPLRRDRGPCWSRSAARHSTCLRAATPPGRRMPTIPSWLPR